MVGIYKITNPENKIYIGYSTFLEKRQINYKNKTVKTQNLIKNSIEKYGWENHKFEIIEECIKEELKEREIFWIKYYKNNGAKLCNLTIGGEGNNGGTHSEETKKKLSLANKGKNKYPKSIQTKEKLSVSIKKYRIDKGINNTMFGGNRNTKGSNNQFSKLNEALVTQIKKLLSDNISVTFIANKFNVTKATISYIKNNKTWTHVKITD
jgi:group I intron endonuclease